MGDSKLTIVIPVKNRAEIFERTLRSVAAQKLRPLKVVIVDNGSTDSTAETARKWCDAVAATGIDALLLGEDSPGVCAARNRGLAAVTTPYVMFFDSDDEMLPGHTQRIADFFEANPGVDLLGFDAVEMDSDGWTEPRVVTDSNVMRGHILHCSFATQRYAAATELVRAAGGWNEELPVWNDFEFGVRLLLHSGSTAFVHGDPGVVIHRSDNSISSVGFAAGATAMERAIEAAEASLAAAGRCADLEWTDARRMVLGALARREGNAEDARRIESKALARAKNLKKKLTLRLVGASVRLTGHGGCAIAAAMLCPEKGSGECH
jgi:glycosyltransferase involved in cell wall biosynthesis